MCSSIEFFSLMQSHASKYIWEQTSRMATLCKSLLCRVCWACCARTEFLSGEVTTFKCSFVLVLSAHAYWPMYTASTHT